MSLNLTQKLIKTHLVSGDLIPGTEIALRIDQTLTQDATGTLVMLELEALGLPRVKTDISVQYVDHNLLQEDHKNPDDHLFLESACARFGLWYSRPGNGVSHPVHMQSFGIPGKTLLGSDSHTPAAGALGMLAFGAGGLEVALAMAGEPYHLTMPQVWGIKLTGTLPEWVSAKDISLELLRRHDVTGGRGRILEFYGPGLSELSAMDRHVIANMGTELGATSTVFPSDEITRAFLKNEGRESDWVELKADSNATYDIEETIDLSSLVPLIAKPSSPGNVVPVRDISGEKIYQAYIGSSANPGYRDMAIASSMVKGKVVPNDVSFDINPASRQLLETMLHEGIMEPLIHALRGEITDPRDLGIPYVKPTEPKDLRIHRDLLKAPLPYGQAQHVSLLKGPNIESLPRIDPFPDTLTLPIMLKVGDNLSTDEILPAGARALPYRSNIQRISDFTFDIIDPTYVHRAKENHGQHAIVGGHNYGQGSSREHAALAPKYLGLTVVLAKSFARIHHSNLVNFGILPLEFSTPQDYDLISLGAMIRFENLHQTLTTSPSIMASLNGNSVRFHHSLTERQVKILLKGGIINWVRSTQTPNL